MLRIETLAQPAQGTVLEVLHAGMADARYTALDASVAYITASGLSALRDNGTQDINLDRLRTRWLTSVDWYRSDPVALAALGQRKAARVRIFDGKTVTAAQGCNPSTPFHPKGFVLSGKNALLMIAGSANLSRNGLTRGVELITLLEVTDPKSAAERLAWKAIEGTRAWFNSVWNGADNYGPLAERYRAAWQTARPTPPITDDTTTKPIASTRGYSTEQLAAMRRSRTFWIEAGNLTPNLGPGNPGNQLMTKALTRVFFGLSDLAVPKQTPLGTVDILYGRTLTQGLTLEYAHNGMDRLNLPKPGAGGPLAYDQQTLVFRRNAVRGRVAYELALATSAEARRLKRASAAEGMSFTMPGQARAYGFAAA